MSKKKILIGLAIVLFVPGALPAALIAGGVVLYQQMKKRKVKDEQ